jgi:membrane protease YdiL (CAAX protease family)
MGETGGRGWSWRPGEIVLDADRLSADHLAVTPTGVANRKAMIVAVTAALALTALNFGATSSPHWFISALEALGADSLADRFRHAFFTSQFEEFNGLVFWGTIQVLSYVAIPILAIRLVLRERVSAYGIEWRGILPHGKHYLVLFAVSVPFVVLASFTQAFQLKYPFYDLAVGEGLFPRMTLWWFVYAAQFVALEFFFRGFLVHGLKWRLGYMAVFVMIIPYNMIHFNKPVIEALAAILGGLVLGSLSLKTRSIWWGAALHIAVAGLMDVLSLTQRGIIF